MKNTQAMLFDVDGVVIRPPKLFSQQYQEKFHAPSDAYLREFFGGVFRECTLGKLDLKEVMSERLIDWRWNGTVEEFLDLWFTSENYPEKALIAKIQDIRKRGVQCYLATNQEKYRTDYMKKEMGFGVLFDGIYTPFEIGYRKPDLEFYTYIVRDLRINPENIVYLDDEVENIERAKELGILGHVYCDIRDVLKLIAQ